MRSAFARFSASVMVAALFGAAGAAGAPWPGMVPPLGSAAFACASALAFEHAPSALAATGATRAVRPALRRKSRRLAALGSVGRPAGFVSFDMLGVVGVLRVEVDNTAEATGTAWVSLSGGAGLFAGRSGCLGRGFPYRPRAPRASRRRGYVATRSAPIGSPAAVRRADAGVSREPRRSRSRLAAPRGAGPSRKSHERMRRMARIRTDRSDAVHPSSRPA